MPHARRAWKSASALLGARRRPAVEIRAIRRWYSEDFVDKDQVLGHRRHFKLASQGRDFGETPAGSSVLIEVFSQVF